MSLKISAQLFSYNYIRIRSLSLRFKQNVIEDQSIAQVICPPETEFLQLVEDNTDHNINTIDGKNRDHDLGSIVVANGNFSSESQQTKVIRSKKQS